MNLGLTEVVWTFIKNLPKFPLGNQVFCGRYGEPTLPYNLRARHFKPALKRMAAGVYPAL